MSHVRQASSRFNGGWCDPIERDQTESEALISFLKYEIGYGGWVTEVTKKTVTVKTPIPAGFDLTTFSGKVDLIIEACAWLYNVRHEGKVNDIIVDRVAKKIADKDGLVSPMVATMFAPMMAGSIKAKIVLFAMIFEKVENYDEEILKKASLEDLSTVIELAEEEGRPRIDVAKDLILG